MARHDGGGQGYAKSLQEFHKKLDLICQGEQMLAVEGESLERWMEDFDQVREKKFTPHAQALFSVINDLTNITLLFSHWQAEKRYFDKRPIQRFLIRRLIKQVTTKAAEAVHRYRKIEQAVFGPHY